MTFRELRQSKGIVQKSLAKLIGKKQSTVSMWENGNSKPRMGDTVFKLAEILETTPETIMRCFFNEENK